MNHRCHDYYPFGFIHFVENPIGKPFRIAPANIPVWMLSAGQQWILLQRTPNPDHFFDEFQTQPNLSVLIPGARLHHVLLHFRAEFDPPAHRARRARTRASISASGRAEAGFRRCSAIRCSTTASSDAGSPASSSSSARRTSACRCPTVSKGNSARTSLKLMIANYHACAMPQAPASHPPRSRECAAGAHDEVPLDPSPREPARVAGLPSIGARGGQPVFLPAVVINGGERVAVQNPMLAPPSTGSVMPVTNRAAGEAR